MKSIRLIPVLTIIFVTHCFATKSSLGEIQEKIAQYEKWIELSAEDIHHCSFFNEERAEREYQRKLWERELEQLGENYKIAYAQQYASAPFKDREIGLLLGEYLLAHKLTTNDSQFLAEQCKDITTVNLFETDLTKLIDNLAQIKSDKILKDGVELIKKYWEELKERSLPLTAQGATFYLRAFMVLDDKQLSEILEFAGID